MEEHWEPIDEKEEGQIVDHVRYIPGEQ